LHILAKLLSESRFGNNLTDMGKVQFPNHWFVPTLQTAERWWSEDEENLQHQAQAAWDLFPLEGIAATAGDLADPEDLADPAGDLGELEDGIAGLMAEPIEPEDNVDMPMFQWHVPEGMPFPAVAPDLPMVNGYHILLPPLNVLPGEVDDMDP
jgi:hypothetical protein